MYFFVGDEHYFHKNIIRFSNRPYVDLEEMHEDFIKRHNSVVKSSDTVVHAGDTSFGTKAQTGKIIERLNGNHIFLAGCHDRWLRKSAPARYIKRINNIIVHVEHYPMRSWFASFHGSINLHAHCHGKMEPLNRQWDVGVDNNDYYPCSFDMLVDKLLNRE